MGSKYEFRPDSNPGVGEYESAYAKEKIMKREGIYATIARPASPARRPKEEAPSPGDYQNDLNTFGNLPQKIGMGRKYEFKPDNNPAVGTYEPEKAFESTASRQGTQGQISP